MWSIRVLVFVSLFAFPTDDLRGKIPPVFCGSVPNIVYCPQGDFTYRVIVRFDDGTGCNPGAGWDVRLRFRSNLNTQVCWCPGGQDPVSGVKGEPGNVEFQSFTDSGGFAEFRTSAGGCIPKDVSNSRYALVLANTVLIGEVGTVSPDVVDEAGRLPADPGYNPTRCEVGLSDATYLTPGFKGAPAGPCGDLDTNGSVGLGDAVLFTPHLSHAHSCERL